MVLMLKNLSGWTGELHTAFVDALPREPDHSISYTSAAARLNRARLVTAIEARTPEPHPKTGELAFKNEEIKAAKALVDALQKEMKANEAKYADERKQAIAEMNKLSQAVEENKKRLEQAEASLKDAQHQLAQAQQRKRRPWWKFW
jgi:chromosome segregation ATPase